RFQGHQDLARRGARYRPQFADPADAHPHEWQRHPRHLRARGAVARQPDARTDLGAAPPGRRGRRRPQGLPPGGADAHARHTQQQERRLEARRGAAMKRKIPTSVTGASIRDWLKDATLLIERTGEAAKGLSKDPWRRLGELYDFKP